MLKKLLDEFTRLREQTVMELFHDREAKKKKVVGIYCTYCPKELILAAGAIPVSLCGTREETISAAEQVLPRNLCPLIKSSYGFAITGKCPFFYFSDLIIGETTCDGKKKMFEIMSSLKPVHVMQLPHLREADAAFELWVAEIRRLGARLESEFGVKIRDEAIWEAVEIIDRERRLVKAICDLNQQDPPPLSGLDLINITWSKGFSSDRGEVLRRLTEIYETLEGGNYTLRKPGPRLLLTGCPVGMGSEKVIRLTEEQGGHVVAMENCTGYKCLELQVDTGTSDPYEALARKYYNIPCSCMSPNTYRLELLGRMINDFHVDGVIDLTWQACHTYNMEAFAVGSMVKQKGLPYLHLESDYSSSDLGNLQVRIEALLELIGA
jgi:benzoyl-CoA reductase/2-hydroxyglutaryl-CoA dehydratase subunit BcrC/BadD/HgdB